MNQSKANGNVDDRRRAYRKKVSQQVQE